MSPDHEKILWLINNYGAVKIYDCSLLVKKPQVYLERICKDLEEAGKIRVDEGPDGETTYCSLCIEDAM